MGTKVYLVLLAILGTSLAVPKPDFAPGEDHDHDHHHDHHHEHHHEDHMEFDSNEVEDSPAPPANAKKCTLVRSSSNENSECFLEPECENVCRNLTNKVRYSNSKFRQILTMPIMLSRSARPTKTRSASPTTRCPATLSMRRSARWCTRAR